MRRYSVVVILMLLVGLPVGAEVRLPHVFADHMVLQRDKPTYLWGWAEADEAISVTFNEEAYAIRAGKNGTWEVPLKATPAGGPFTLVIAGTNTITLEDVLVGDVWICSGQSNMGWPVDKSRDAESEIAAADFPQIRSYILYPNVALAPQGDANGQWRIISPETVGNVSAVAYYFGREIHRDIEVPVGLISTAWGGTPIESWMSPGASSRSEAFAQLKADWADDVAKQGAAIYSFYTNRGDDRIEKPETTRGLGPAPNVPSLTYNAMIAPLGRMGIKGAIWYQGESNADRAYQYRELMTTLIDDWRGQFRQGDFPFIITQLANFKERASEPGPSAWAELREAQALATRLPEVGLATIIDIGEGDNIHPANKQDVGYRLAQSALNIAYGKHVLPAGPTYAGMKIKGNTIEIRYDNVGGGLTTWNRDSGENVFSDGREEPPLTGFAIAGEDQKFVWARARIEGKKILVSSETVDKPVAVRHGWADNPACNLYNTESVVGASYKKPHLPAAPFRTDDFPMVTRDNK